MSKTCPEGIVLQKTFFDPSLWYFSKAEVETLKILEKYTSLGNIIPFVLTQPRLFTNKRKQGGQKKPDRAQRVQ